MMSCCFLAVCLYLALVAVVVVVVVGPAGLPGARALDVDNCAGQQEVTTSTVNVDELRFDGDGSCHVVYSRASSINSFSIQASGMGSLRVDFPLITTLSVASVHVRGSVRLTVNFGNPANPVLSSVNSLQLFSSDAAKLLVNMYGACQGTFTGLSSNTLAGPVPATFNLFGFFTFAPNNLISPKLDLLWNGAPYDDRTQMSCGGAPYPVLALATTTTTATTTTLTTATTTATAMRTITATTQALATPDVLQLAVLGCLGEDMVVWATDIHINGVPVHTGFKGKWRAHFQVGVGGSNSTAKVSSLSSSPPLAAFGKGGVLHLTGRNVELVARNATTSRPLTSIGIGYDGETLQLHASRLFWNGTRVHPDALAEDAFMDSRDSTGIIVVSGQRRSGAGTRRVQCYTIDTDSWSRLPDYPVLTLRSGAIQLPDRRVLVLGGYGSFGSLVPAMPTAYFLQMESGCAHAPDALWTKGPPLNQGRNSHQLSCDVAGNVFAFGGRAGRGYGRVTGVERLRFQASSWEIVEMSPSLETVGLALGHLYVQQLVGGEDDPPILLRTGEPHALFTREEEEEDEEDREEAMDDGGGDNARVLRDITEEDFEVVGVGRASTSIDAASMEFLHRDGNREGDALKAISVKEEEGVREERVVVEGTHAVLKDLYNPTLVEAGGSVYMLGGLDWGVSGLPASPRLYRVDAASSVFIRLADMEMEGQERPGACGVL